MEVYNVIILLFKNDIHTVQCLPDGGLKITKILEFFLGSTLYALLIFCIFFLPFFLALGISSVSEEDSI